MSAEKNKPGLHTAVVDLSENTKENVMIRRAPNGADHGANIHIEGAGILYLSLGQPNELLMLLSREENEGISRINENIEEIHKGQEIKRNVREGCIISIVVSQLSKEAAILSVELKSNTSVGKLEKQREAVIA